MKRQFARGMLLVALLAAGCGPVTVVFPSAGKNGHAASPASALGSARPTAVPGSTGPVATGSPGSLPSSVPPASSPLGTIVPAGDLSGAGCTAIADQVLTYYDANHDGRFSFDEFRRSFQALQGDGGCYEGRKGPLVVTATGAVFAPLVGAAAAPAAWSVLELGCLPGPHANFVEADLDHDGYLSRQELCATRYLSGIGDIIYHAGNAPTFFDGPAGFKAADANGDGAINFAEFRDAVCINNGEDLPPALINPLVKAEMQKLFDAGDANHDGQLDITEWCARGVVPAIFANSKPVAMPQTPPPAASPGPLAAAVVLPPGAIAVPAQFDSIDTNHDGRIDLDEYDNFRWAQISPLLGPTPADTVGLHIDLRAEFTVFDQGGRNVLTREEFTNLCTQLVADPSFKTKVAP